MPGEYIYRCCQTLFELQKTSEKYGYKFSDEVFQHVFKEIINNEISKLND